jgi:hypothetical protein
MTLARKRSLPLILTDLNTARSSSSHTDP